MNMIKRLCTLASLIAALAAAGGCGDKKSAPPPAPTTPAASAPKAGWQYKDGTDHQVAVVFIHGIFGDAIGTWTNANNETFFKYIKADPSVGNKIDIHAFGFESSMFSGGSLDIEESADLLKRRLQADEVLKYPRLVLVAHSMGGLVAMRFLLRNPDIAETTPLIVLYATPHEGAQIAEIADRVAHNPALKNMFGADSNVFLRQLDGDWERSTKKPHVTCAYETADTAGIRIVPWTSATRTCGSDAMAVGKADHITIVKPSGPDHDSVMLLKTSLQTYVTTPPIAAKLDTPDFIIEGDHWVVTLRSFTEQRSSRLVNSGGSPLSYTFAEQDDGLHVVPYPTPRSIDAGKAETMFVSLAFGADKAEYPFKLQSNSGPDRMILVRIPDLKAFAASKEEAIKKMLLSIEAATGEGAPQGTNALTERGLVDIANKSVADQFPGVPKYQQAVLTAEMLNAANWPSLAKVSLRDAEAHSQEITQSPAVQKLAGTIALKTGDDKVFARGALAKNYLGPRSNVDFLSPKIVANDPKIDALSARLQKTPGLERLGYSLEGDARASEGNFKAAENSFVKAHAAASLDYDRDRAAASVFASKVAEEATPAASTANASDLDVAKIIVTDHKANLDDFVKKYKVPKKMDFQTFDKAKIDKKALAKDMGMMKK